MYSSNNDFSFFFLGGMKGTAGNFVGNIPGASPEPMELKNELNAPSSPPRDLRYFSHRSI